MIQLPMHIAFGLYALCFIAGIWVARRYTKELWDIYFWMERNPRKAGIFALTILGILIVSRIIQVLLVSMQ